MRKPRVCCCAAYVLFLRRTDTVLEYSSIICCIWRWTSTLNFMAAVHKIHPQIIISVKAAFSAFHTIVAVLFGLIGKTKRLKENFGISITFRPDILILSFSRLPTQQIFCLRRKKMLINKFFSLIDIIKIEIFTFFFSFYRPTQEKVPREDPRS